MLTAKQLCYTTTPLIVQQLADETTNTVLDYELETGACRHL